MKNDSMKRTILTVDDDDINLRIYDKIFSRDYSVIEAHDGEEALAILKNDNAISAVILDLVMPRLDGYGVLREMHRESKLWDIPVIVATAIGDDESQLKALKLGAIDVLVKPINAMIAMQRVRNAIIRVEAIQQRERNSFLEEQLRISEIDELTGIYNKEGFCRRTAELIKQNPDKKYMILRWDIDGFKILNDTFGTEKGDAFLRDMGEEYRKNAVPGMTYGHWVADHFVVCIERQCFNEDDIVHMMNAAIEKIFPNFKCIPRIGVYFVDDPSVEVSLMCDRAMLALRSIKYNYNRQIAYYDETMRKKLIEEQVVVSEMDAALSSGQFVIYFQPQYDYEEGTIYGAEALVRWKHPKRGLLSPAAFINIFEHNGFITKLDEYVWEQVCIYIRQWTDKGIPVVPISINVSRRDIYQPDLCEKLLKLVHRFDLKPSSLRLEITESAYMENPEQMIGAVKKFHSAGFTVDMDDFGSGYSSLNTLKDVPMDTLKLDMKFLSDSSNEERSGNILTAVVRMAYWISMHVIAEGVETKTQADFLKSINCIYMQGFYFAKPMPAEEFASLLKDSKVEIQRHREFAGDKKGAVDFLSDSIQSTVIFNSFVGGAAILEYDGTRLQALRVNDKYFKMLGTTRDSYRFYMRDIFSRMDEANKAIYIERIKKAIKSGSEELFELETLPLNPDGEKVWTLNRIRVLSKKEGIYIIFLSADNITEQKRGQDKVRALSDQFTNMIKSLPIGIAIYKVEENVYPIFISDRTCEMFGFTREEYDQRINGGDPVNFTPDLKKFWDKYGAMIKKGGPVTIPKMHVKRKDESWFFLSAYCTTVRDKDSVICYAALVDVTENIKADRKSIWQTERYRLLSKMPGAITFDYDPSSDVMHLSKTDYGKVHTEKTIDHLLLNLPKQAAIAPESREVLAANIKKASESSGSGETVFLADYFATGFRWYQASYVSIADDACAVYRIVGRVDDIHDSVMEKERLLLRTHKDEAVGLYNKVYALRSMQMSLRKKPKERMDALMFVDVDRFKNINDTVGHLEGDKILREIAAVLKKLFRSEDIVARYGGDEFMVYMPGAGSVENVRKRAIQIIRNVNKIPVAYEERVRVSIGIAGTVGESVSAQEMLRRADEAMYQAKEKGKNRCVIYKKTKE